MALVLTSRFLLKGIQTLPPLIPAAAEQAHSLHVVQVPRDLPSSHPYAELLTTLEQESDTDVICHMVLWNYRCSESETTALEQAVSGLLKP